MKKLTTMLLKKPILAGIAVGAILVSTVTAGAMTSDVCAELRTKNPITAPPKGYAWTMGSKYITAKCKVTKNGESKAKEASLRTSGGSVETDWVSGPTWNASGTRFNSTHTGYDNKGNYETLYRAKSY